MATATTEGPRKRGRPARYGQGRTSLHVRFTPERTALLKALADSNGRSLSEQVEFVVEDHARVEEMAAKLTAETQGLLAQIHDHMDQLYKEQQQKRKFQDEVRKLKEEIRSLKEESAPGGNRLAERVAALEQAIKGGKK